MASQEKSKVFGDSDMQSIIGWILRIGVIVSVTVVAIGGTIFLWRHGHSTPDFREFRKIPYFISSPEGVFEGVMNGKGQAIIQLGIMILIATPVMRVVFAIIAFAIEKDRLYTLISVIVLLIILGSMLTGRIG